MKKDNTKTIKIVRIVFLIVVILIFMDFALGGFLDGWINPK